jgi:arabinogalactan oligomer / maltooligosaccharide transport system substrate-binding protein
MLRKRFFLGLMALTLALGTLGSVMAQDDNTLLIWADNERAPLIESLADQVEADLGITLEVQVMGLGDARDQLLVAGPAGEGPDILITAHDSIGQFVANGAIVPIELDEEFRAMFTETALNLFTYNGQLWGVPYATENVALIRNVDLVPEAPKTWQEVRAISEAIHEADPNKYGFVIQTGNTYHNFPITSAFGGYIFGTNEDGTFNTTDVGLASEGGLKAADWLSRMYKDGLMPTNVTDDVVFDLFTSGDAAMFITGPWFSKRIAETGVNFSIDPIPGAEDGMEVGAPFAGGQGFVISAFSDKQLLAETFLLDYVATTDFMQAIFDQGGRPSAFVDVDTSTDAAIAGFTAAGANAIPMPAIPEMNAVWASSDAALNLISQGEDAVESMNNAVTQIGEAIVVQQTGATNSITIAGSMQDEAGCAADWDPKCENTFLTNDGTGIWTGTFTLPAGEYEYKFALNADWAENYGLNNESNGGNIPLVLTEETAVTFTFDNNEHVGSDSVNNP